MQEWTEAVLRSMLVKPIARVAIARKISIGNTGRNVFVMKKPYLKSWKIISLLGLIYIQSILLEHINMGMFSLALNHSIKSLYIFPKN